MFNRLIKNEYFDQIIRKYFVFIPKKTPANLQHPLKAIIPVK